MVINYEQYAKSVIYVTDDLLNEKEVAEIIFLQKAYPKLIIATTEKTRVPNLKIKYLRLKKKEFKILIKFWLKFTFICSKACKSKSDQKFPLRNIYCKNKVLTIFINLIWKLKIKSGVNKLLPNYQTMAFLPIKISYMFKKKISKKRLHIINSLIIHHGELYPYIGWVNSTSQPVIAIIKSWDNPFYTQFYSEADAYIGWGDGMKSDICKIQNKYPTNYISWGPKPFENFYKNLINSMKYTKKSEKLDEIIIGYAAAYGDDEMLDLEMRLILDLSKQLDEINKSIKILLRPYPTVSIEKYKKIKNIHNIKIVEIKGESVNRGAYNNESIKFGGVLEKSDFLSKCNVFLSIATSFTIEAIIFGKPTLQLYVNKNERKLEFEKLFFQRIDVCDHLLKYFLKNIEVVSNMKDFIQAYTRGIDDTRYSYLLNSLGINEFNQKEQDKLSEIQKISNSIA